MLTKGKTTVLAVCLAVLWMACSSDQENKSTTRTTSEKMLTLIEVDGAYWSHTTPLAFLDTLRIYSDSCIFMAKEYPPPEWFDTTQLARIREYVNITTESGYIFSVYESHLHENSERSTVGCQAEHLLKAYEDLRYPTLLCSLHGNECDYRK